MAVDKELLSQYYNMLKDTPMPELMKMRHQHKMYVESKEQALEQELAANKAVMEAAAAVIRDNLQASGSKGMSFEGLGSVTLVSSSKYSIGQADALQNYISQHPEMNPIDIFGTTLKKAGVEEFLERTGLTAESLGIKPYTEITVRFNAPRGSKATE
jgi:hypothetical protein